MNAEAYEINDSCANCDRMYHIPSSDAPSLTRKYCSAECYAAAMEGQAVRREDRTGYYSGRTA